MKNITYLFKKVTGIALALIMVLLLSNTIYAADITNASSTIDSEYTKLAVQEIITNTDNNDNGGKLLDTVVLSMDSNGNFRNAKEITLNGWFTDNVLVVYNFYDMGTNSSGGHKYEVQMTATALDTDIYFTRHILQAQPKNNTDWFKSDIKHSIIDYKSVIGDAISYSYPDAGPSKPTVKVKGSYTLSGFGTFSTPTVTLSKPIS